jgi:ribosomal protein L17
MVRRKPPEKPLEKSKTPRKDPDFQNLEKMLNKPGFAKKVKQNIQLKRQAMVLEAQIAVLKSMFAEASGREREKIGRMLRILKKTKKIGDRAFYKKVA